MRKSITFLASVGALSLSLSMFVPAPALAEGACDFDYTFCMRVHYEVCNTFGCEQHYFDVDGRPTDE